MTVVSGVATIIAFVLLLWPSSSSCSGEGASLANISVEQNVRFRDYLERTNASTEGYLARQLDMPVNVISYELRIAGFKSDHITSKWSLYEANTNSPVPDDSLRNRLALDVEPTACETRLHPAIWTPTIERRGRFYFKLFVYDESGNLLAEGRTRPPLSQGA